jgi:hypothetical protein
MVHFGFLKRSVYLVFLEFSKKSAADNINLKGIQSPKHDDLLPESRNKPNVLQCAKKTQNLPNNRNDIRGENLRIYKHINLSKITCAYKIRLSVNYRTADAGKIEHTIKSSQISKQFILNSADIYKIWAHNILQRHYKFIMPNLRPKRKRQNITIKFLLNAIIKFTLRTRNI